MRPQRELITPDRACELLDANTHNRNFRWRDVTKIARDILANHWLENGETIKVATDGTLIDGQHRLMAVVEADRAVWMLVVYDLPLEVQKTVDIGAKRQFGDMLALRSVADPRETAAVTRLVHHWSVLGVRDGVTTSRNSTYAELEETFDKYADRIRDATVFCRRSSRQFNIRPAIVGLAYFLFAEISLDDAEKFFNRFIDGVDLSKGNPVLALRNHLLEGRRASGEKAPRLEPSYQLAVMIKAWNAFRTHKTVQLLRFTASEVYPEPK